MPAKSVLEFPEEISFGIYPHNATGAHICMGKGAIKWLQHRFDLKAAIS